MEHISGLRIIHANTDIFTGNGLPRKFSALAVNSYIALNHSLFHTQYRGILVRCHRLPAKMTKSRGSLSTAKATFVPWERGQDSLLRAHRDDESRRQLQLVLRLTKVFRTMSDLSRVGIRVDAPLCRCLLKHVHSSCKVPVLRYTRVSNTTKVPGEPLP